MCEYHYLLRNAAQLTALCRVIVPPCFNYLDAIVVGTNSNTSKYLIYLYVKRLGVVRDMKKIKFIIIFFASKLF